jgi:hypothetical protein
MPPDEPTDEERLEELPEDNQTPFHPAAPPRNPAAPADDTGQQSSAPDDTHPSTDTDVEQEELYDQGIDVVEPNAGNAVVDYEKPDEVQPS